MLTLALLTLSTADARPASYHKCSGFNPHVGSFSYLISTPACDCLKAKDASSDWWGGVDMSLRAPEDRPDGTCFENDVWETSFTGAAPSTENKVRANLYDIADAIAIDESVMYFPSTFDIYWGWSEASIVNMGEGEEISGGGDPNDFQFPWELLFGNDPDGPYVMFDPNGHPWFDLMAPVGLSHVYASDGNDDQITDLVVVFEDGDVWEIEGPIGYGELITPPQD